jgi:hypothetical protein
MTSQFNAKTEMLNQMSIEDSLSKMRAMAYEECSCDHSVSCRPCQAREALRNLAFQVECVVIYLERT